MSQIIVDVTYNYTVFSVQGDFVPYTPAKINGPIESCHPEEGGYIEDALVFHWGDDITEVLSDEAYKDICDLAWDEASLRSSGGKDDDAYEAAVDAEMERRAK